MTDVHYHCETCGNPCASANGVWVLSRDDGNSCCPAEEWVSIHITKESADLAKAEALATRGRLDTEHYTVKHWPVMARILIP